MLVAGGESPKNPAVGPWWPRALLLALPLIVLGIVMLMATRGTLKMDQGVELSGVSLPESVAVGETLPLDLQIKTSGPLDGDYWMFMHIEASSESPSSHNCRIVHDRPAPSGPTTQWAAGQTLTHHVDVPIPSTCKADEFRIFMGLWNRTSGNRLKVIDPRTADNRVQVATIELTPMGTAKGAMQSRSARAIKMQAELGTLLPWKSWGLAILVAAALAMVLERRLAWRVAEGKEEEVEPPQLSREMRWGGLLAPAIPLFLGVLVVLEFIKDDAYISFRYAHNFVKGQGLVFNPGEKLEGYTNFLWTMLMVPFEALGWDLFQVCEVLGTLLSIAAIVQLSIFSMRIDTIGPRKDFSWAWGSMWLATSSSWVLWAKSGLEQPLAALLPLIAAYLLFQARDVVGAEGDDAKQADKRMLLAGVLMGLGCATRPEIHLVAVIVGLPLVLDAVVARKIEKRSLRYVAGVLAITIPFHAFRLGYYKSLFPNTFYVKTGSNGLIWREGLHQLHEMFSFNDLGWLVVLAPFAFANRKRIVEKATAAIISLAFMAYVVKVGVDEMQWFRLYLPALPFLLLLAMNGLRNVLDAVASFTKSPASSRSLLAALGWGAVLYACSMNFQFTYRELGGFNGHADLAGTYHPDLGKFIVRHERPGGLVAFQDMGSTPYHAPDIDFLDFIGLVDGTVARARHSYGLHAFIPFEEGDSKTKYDAEMRAYYWKRNPEWAILTVYPPRDEEGPIADRFARDPTPEAIGNAFHNNSFQFGIWADPKFHESYVHVRTWQRSRGYYLALFRRKDLWNQIPREVVLDAPPADLTGPKVKLERGLEMLGGKVDPETKERHEVMITTWWKTPGPMEPDVTFFVHVNKEGFQAPQDHVPGDSMYPAPRWRAGDIVEDRILFQLPINLRPGTYNVHVGVYRKSPTAPNGGRFKVLEGPNDGTDRILVGTFVVKPLIPMLHQLIPPTNVEVMRKYPDRIVDSGRKH